MRQHEHDLSVLRALAVQMAVGGMVGCGVACGILLLDIGGVGTLVATSSDPTVVIVFVVGTMLAFHSVVIVTAISAPDLGASTPGRPRARWRLDLAQRQCAKSGESCAWQPAEVQLPKNRK